MAYAIANPTSLSDVHPTQPDLKVPKQVAWSPDKFRWAVGARAASELPLGLSQLSSIQTRVVELELNGGGGNAAKIETFYSSVSITNAVYRGWDSFEAPADGDAFYATLTDATGTHVRTQLWRFVGIGSAVQWTPVTDTQVQTTVDAETLTRLDALETGLGLAQSSIGNQVEANVTVRYESDSYAPTDGSTPTTVLALDPLLYGDGEVVRVWFIDAQCDYQYINDAWVRIACRMFSTAGDMPPLHPHSTAKVQRFETGGVRYFGYLRDGGDIAVSMLNVANGKANWILPYQQYGLFHHPAIMHMADVGSEWHLANYTGHDIGGGVIGGSFTLTDPAAELAELQATPIGNPVFTERK